MVQALPVATIIVYVILALPIFYCVRTHGRTGLVGWGTLQVFCLLRIVGSIIQIKDESNGQPESTAALVILNIGLSPLLLGTVGILHEARVGRNPDAKPALEWRKVIAYHLLVILSTVLFIIGIIHDKDNNNPHPSALRKAGVIVFLLAFLVLAAWILWSYRQPERKSLPAWRDATILLGSATLVLPFVLLRIIYVLIITFSTNQKLNNSLAAKVCLSVVPEMLALAVFAVNGVRTRNIMAKHARTPEQGQLIGLERYPQVQDQREYKYGEGRA